jgi:hypothetical protein
MAGVSQRETTTNKTELKLRAEKKDSEGTKSREKKGENKEMITKILLESTVDSLTCYSVFLSPFSFF